MVCKLIKEIGSHPYQKVDEDSISVLLIMAEEKILENTNTGKHHRSWIFSDRGNGGFHDDIKCYACQTLGHYADQCTGQTLTIFSQKGIMLSQGKHVIKNTWLLLETLLSNSALNNPRMLKFLKKCKNKYILMVQTNCRIKKISTPQVYIYSPFRFTIT